MDLKIFDQIARDSEERQPKPKPNFATVSRVVDEEIYVVMDGDSDEFPSGIKRFGHVSCDTGDRVHILRDNGAMYISSSFKDSGSGGGVTEEYVVDKIGEHNTSNVSHEDIRLSIKDGIDLKLDKIGKLVGGLGNLQWFPYRANDINYCNVGCDGSGQFYVSVGTSEASRRIYRLGMGLNGLGISKNLGSTWEEYQIKNKNKEVFNGSVTGGQTINMSTPLHNAFDKIIMTFTIQGSRSSSATMYDVHYPNMKYQDGTKSVMVLGGEVIFSTSGIVVNIVSVPTGVTLNRIIGVMEGG